MNVPKISRALALLATSILLSAPAQANITTFFSAGGTCAGGPAAAFSTSGPAVTVTLCVTTTTEALCSANVNLQSAVGENGRFSVGSRALGSAFPDPNSSPGFPFPINNPATAIDFGGTVSTTPLTIVPAGNTTPVATFTLLPQANATNNAYAISLTPTSTVAVDTDTTCGAPVEPAISATLNLGLSAAPVFTSGAVPAGVVNTPYTFTFTASGSPSPTFTTAGPLPAGINLAANGTLSGTPTVAGGPFNFTVIATNGVNPAANQAASLTIAAAAQTITFNNPGAQIFTASPLASGATATSGLPVTLTSATPTVCTITPANSLNITFVTAGNCTINANQAGNASFGAAPQVPQTFAITAVAPGAPTVSAAAGNTQGTLTITPPVSNGGSVITGYAAVCNPNAGTDAAAGTTTLTRVITGLVNNISHTCTVTATNAAGTGAGGVSNAFTPSPLPVAPSFTSANSSNAYTVNVAGPVFNITATGVPTPTITLGSGTLPTGMSFTSGGANTGTATLTGTPTQAGTFNLVFTATGTAPPANQAFTLTVAAAAQTITFPNPGAQVFSAATVPLTATASSGLAVAYTSATPAVCSVAGANVTKIAVGNCTINANQAGNANFAAAPQVPMTFAITQAAQTITFGAQVSPRGFSASPQAINPLATATSALPVTYSSLTPAICSVSGASFTSVGLGVCTIAANQAGNGNYSAAVAQTQSITITQGAQIISFGSLPDQPLGVPPVQISPTASSGLAVTVTSSTPAVCATSGINGTTITLLILGTCTLQGTQAGNVNFAAAAPTTASFNVIPPGAVNLTSSMNPALYRTPLILTANIQGTAPTGTVTFFYQSASGPVNLCPNVPLVNASATCPVPATLNVVNSTTYSATYSGDGSNPSNTSSYLQLVNLSSTSLSVVSTPVQPIVGATVTLKATVAATTISNKVTFNENGVALTGCAAVTVSPLPGATNIGVASCTITGITAGLHNYVVSYPHVGDLGFEQVIVPITPLSNTAADYTDMWWVGLSENGWGVSISQHGRNQFIVLYVYDAFGNPIWYVLPQGTWNAANTAFTGALYQPTSSPFSSYLDALNFKPGGVTGASVGTATVTYTGSGTAILTYTINGVSGSKSIIRQAFATDDGQPKMNVGDMWWAGFEQNGWGMNIAQQGRVLFPVWYTYDGQGRTVFYAVPGGVWTGSTFTGDIYSTVSSVWLGVNYNPAQFVVTKIGTMSLDFSDQSNAVMSYTIGGVVQKKVITRQPF